MSGSSPCNYNVICRKCWGLIKKTCKCKGYSNRRCKCAKPVPLFDLAALERSMETGGKG